MGTPQYDVFIAGSGPVACTFARAILDARPATTIYMAEIGSQDHPIVGGHHKNTAKYQKDIDMFVNVIKGALQPFSIPPEETYLSTLGGDAWRHSNTRIVNGKSVPNDKVLIYQGRNPNQDVNFNLRDSAATRTVGGMSTHWTANCPKPNEADERAIGKGLVPFEDTATDHYGFKTTFATAEAYLNVNRNEFDMAIRHTVVKKALTDTLPTARQPTLANLDLAVKRNVSPENTDFVTWSSASTVLGTHLSGVKVNPTHPPTTPAPAPALGLHTQKRVTRLIGTKDVNSDGDITGVLVRDLSKEALPLSPPDPNLTGADFVVTAKVYILAAGAICTPQILWNSDHTPSIPFNNAISPPALGRYLSEQSIAFCQIVLSKKIVDAITPTATYLTAEQRAKITAHQATHPKDPIPIPFNDPEPQLTLRYTPDVTDAHGNITTPRQPWHVQIHRDAFSYGDVGPKADSRVVVDLRWFGKSDIKEDNRVIFGPLPGPTTFSWAAGVKDIYGMPQPTFIVERSDQDRERDQRMMKEMCEVANLLGGFVPGSYPAFMEPGLALHTTGTTRMGKPDADGRTLDSVVDDKSKVHNIKNLWLGGCSVIPDSVASNPTCTAMAYAIRSAASIVAYLGP